MIVLTVTYNPRADVSNWLRIADTDRDAFCLTKEYPCNRSIPLDRNRIDELIASIDPSVIRCFETQAALLERRWRELEMVVVKKITDHLGIPFSTMDARASLTTAYRMPYDFKDKWFMAPTHKPVGRQLAIITHELFHLYQLTDKPDTPRQQLEIDVEVFIASLEPELFG